MVFKVDCDRCDYSERTESYERAKDLKYNHHIPTGHNPIIKEE
jgi:hypothetical protein